MKLFVTAIGTDSGKTLVSAILTKALKASYWKPVQAGAPKDKDEVHRLVPDADIIPEAFDLTKPMSPHAAAEFDGIDIKVSALDLPEVTPLVVEGAGGIMVPLSSTETILDLVKHLDLEVVLVVNMYLGCINHALLSIDALKYHSIKVKGLIYNGEGFDEARTYIKEYSGLPLLLSIPKLSEVNTTEITRLAEELCLEL